MADRIPDLRSDEAYAAYDSMVNLLPGPVTPHPDVWHAFCTPPVSHRAASFVSALQETKSKLCALVGSRHAELLLGSGTLANDLVGSYLAATAGLGAILVNGEFGERLVDHGRRLGLDFMVLRSRWGTDLEYERLEQMAGEIDWIWFTHCETSTGMMNDLPRVTAMANRHEIRLCVDAISSIGVSPTNLSTVFLASGVANKGLAALPGLAIIFYNEKPLATQGLVPRYLDLDYYAVNNGVPFTTSSNLLFALRAALERLDPARRYARLRELSDWLHRELAACGLDVLVPPAASSPAVLTIVLPEGTSSLAIGEELERRGYLLSYRSRYLIERNLIQICLMSAVSRSELARTRDLLVQLAGP